MKLFPRAHSSVALVATLTLASGGKSGPGAASRFSSVSFSLHSQGLTNPRTVMYYTVVALLLF